VRGLTSTFFARLFAAGALIAVGAVVGRLFGPAARGAVGMLVVLRLGLHAFGTFGLTTANTWAVARDPSKYGPAARTSLAVSLVVGGAAAAALGAVLLANPRWFAPVSPLWAFVFLATAPAILGVQLEGGVLLGAGRVGAWNVLTVVNRTLLLAALGLAAAPGLRSIDTVAAGFAFAEAAAFATALALLRAPGGLAPRVDRQLLVDLRRYGAVSWVHGLLTYALLRIDVLILGTWRGTEEAGLYEAGGLAREVILFLPWIVGMLFMPRVAGADAGRGAAPRALGWRWVVTALAAAVALEIWPEEFVTGIHGDDFAGAAGVVRVTVPAALLAGGSNLFLQYLLGRGAPAIVIWAPAAALATNLAANAVLVPRLGAMGAAWSALATQALLFALTGLGARRLAKRSPLGVTREAGAGPAAG
jgi:O-antigen/teichoic acid export membrane protein